jgi:pimeloyl-ACP methyl ester carboxylesterase
VRDRAAALRERAALGDRASALRERAPVERVRRRRAAEAAALAAAAPLPAVPPTGTGRIRPEHSHTADLGGPVHWVEHEAQGEVTGPPVVCVHGLGGSHANWHDLAPLLAQHRRVVALDLAGFGRTPRAGRSASVRANRALLDRFLAEVVGEPAVLVGNSMGGTLSVLEAAAHPERVVELVLIGPAGPRPRRELPDAAVARQAALFAVPGVAEKVLVRRLERLGAEGWVRQQMSLTTVDASRVSEQMRQAAVDLIASRAAGPDAEAAFLEAARSLVALLARAARYRDAVCSVRAPALVVHGALDRLVPVSCSRALVELRPDWQLEVLDGVGHVPQIEVPGRTAAAIGAWLERDRTAHPEPVEAPHDH